jgi:hypothetical protein
MRSTHLAIFSFLCVATAPTTLTAQLPVPRPRPPISAPLPRAAPNPPNLLDDDDRAGPRLGVAYLIGGSVTAERERRTLSPLISLFGWQLEHQFETGPRKTTVPVMEFIGLVGGMEQGAFLPSGSWLIGIRQPNGWEAALGPTVTGAGVQLAFAAGITHAIGKLNVPVNLAVAPGRRGASVSITTGFNTKHGP